MTEKIINLRLTKLDRDILKHVHDHRLTTFEVLLQTFFAHKSAAALKSTLRRLCSNERDSSLLRSAPLAGKHVYYYLTSLGTKFLGCSREVAGPLGPQARYHRYAVLSFIHHDPAKKRVRFDPRRFEDVFQLRGHRLNRNDFFIEEPGDKPRLGTLIVDHGAHPRRIVIKTLQRLKRFLRHRWFDDFIRDGAFNVTILTLSEGKRETIVPLLRQAVRLSLVRPGRFGLDERVQWVDFQVSVIPGLQELLPGLTTKEER